MTKKEFEKEFKIGDYIAYIDDVDTSSPDFEFKKVIEIADTGFFIKYENYSHAMSYNYSSYDLKDFLHLDQIMDFKKKYDERISVSEAEKLLGRKIDRWK
jgi:hypothetical protein